MITVLQKTGSQSAKNYAVNRKDANFLDDGAIWESPWGKLLPLTQFWRSLPSPARCVPHSPYVFPYSPSFPLSTLPHVWAGLGVRASFPGSFTFYSVLSVGLLGNLATGDWFATLSSSNWINEYFRILILYRLTSSFGNDATVARWRVNSFGSSTMLRVVMNEHVVGNGQERPVYVHLAGDYYLQKITPPFRLHFWNGLVLSSALMFSKKKFWQP